MRVYAIGITLTMLFTLCPVIKSDEALVTSFSVWADDDLGEGGSVQAYLTANEGIRRTKWG